MTGEGGTNTEKEGGAQRERDEKQKKRKWERAD